jgi:polyisoprenoid-binding protein YceI
MSGKSDWNSLFKRMFCFFGMSALFFVTCPAPLISAKAVDRPAQTDENRPVDKALPAPGSYNIDSAHSFAYFGARHHVVGLVRGRFDKVTGTINVAKDLAACAVDVSIDVSSLNTQNTERDDDLRSPTYFDAKKFPAMTYQGRGIRRVSDGTWVMDGSLTMHGVTRMVPLTFNFNGVFSDTKPGRPARVAFHGSTGVKRAEFGMGARDNLDELGMLTTPDVAIEIDVEADGSSPAK